MESRKRKRWLIALTAGVIAFAFWFFVLRNTEPAYKGRRLSEWVRNYQVARGSWADRHGTSFRIGESDPTAMHECEQAIRAIGTNGLPHLVAWVAQGPAPWGDQRARIARHLPKWMTQWKPVQSWIGHSEDEKRAEAVLSAFGVLGAQAAPAIPQLERIVYETNQGPQRHRALTALAFIGLPSYHAMTNFMTRPAFDGEYTTVEFYLRYYGIDALPTLLQNLASQNEHVAAPSALLLGQLRQEPDKAIPVLIKATTSPIGRVRALAAHALGDYGPEAASAVPALQSLLSHTDVIERIDAQMAIQYITGKLPELPK